MLSPYARALLLGEPMPAIPADKMDAARRHTTELAEYMDIEPHPQPNWADIQRPDSVLCQTAKDVLRTLGHMGGSNLNRLWMSDSAEAATTTQWLESGALGVVLALGLATHLLDDDAAPQRRVLLQSRLPGTAASMAVPLLAKLAQQSTDTTLVQWIHMRRTPTSRDIQHALGRAYHLARVAYATDCEAALARIYDELNASAAADDDDDDDNNNRAVRTLAIADTSLWTDARLLYVLGQVARVLEHGTRRLAVVFCGDHYTIACTLLCQIADAVHAVYSSTYHRFKRRLDGDDDPICTPGARATTTADFARLMAYSRIERSGGFRALLTRTMVPRVGRKGDTVVARFLTEGLRLAFVFYPRALDEHEPLTLERGDASQENSVTLEWPCWDIDHRVRFRREPGAAVDVLLRRNEPLTTYAERCAQLRHIVAVLLFHVGIQHLTFHIDPITGLSHTRLAVPVDGADEPGPADGADVPDRDPLNEPSVWGERADRVLWARCIDAAARILANPDEDDQAWPRVVGL